MYDHAKLRLFPHKSKHIATKSAKASESVPLASAVIVFLSPKVKRRWYYLPFGVPNADISDFLDADICAVAVASINDDVTRVIACGKHCHASHANFYGNKCRCDIYLFHITSESFYR